MKTAGKIKFNLKSLLFISSLFISFSLMSQWGVAYSSGWGNSGLESYPNFFKSIDYVGDGINGHRLDIYYPTELKINLNNLEIFKNFITLTTFPGKIWVSIHFQAFKLWVKKVNLYNVQKKKKVKHSKAKIID